MLTACLLLGQIGVVSWGIGCARLEQDGDNLSGYPGVYVRLANYKQWLIDQLAEWGTQPRFAQRRGPGIGRVVVKPPTSRMPCSELTVRKPRLLRDALVALASGPFCPLAGHSSPATGALLIVLYLGRDEGA